MAEHRLTVNRVAVIGAGVSGVSAAIHLKREGLDITVYERSARAGGVWVHDKRSARDAAYPSTLPSIGDSPEYQPRRVKRETRQDSPLQDEDDRAHECTNQPADENIALDFAPPGPCYNALKNNVSTTEMQLSCQEWRPGTEEFVPHHVLADYIQDTARNNNVLSEISFNSRVDKVEKDGKQWRLEISSLGPKQADGTTRTCVEYFDAVVVSVGNYHACNIPDIPGLSKWKAKFPDRIQHSKLYRKPDDFQGQNVLLIGSGVSSMDIAKDLAGVARSVFQSSRGGHYDLPSHMLPETAARVANVERFDDLDFDASTVDGAIPGKVTLASGQQLCNIHKIIVCTGYHVSFPFMRQYHADGMRAEDADDTVLVTDGRQTHNLHKDIWYIPDPTLAFVGVPYHVATFSLFEFQAMALAQVFAGIVSIPSRESMREEYLERLARKGAGRPFHSLKLEQGELTYVQDLVDMVAQGKGSMPGHEKRFLDAYERRSVRIRGLFSKSRDESIDAQVISLVTCATSQ